jgi:transposase
MARLLTTIPGIGVVNATALVAAIGATPGPSGAAATWQHGWGWCQGR